MDFLDSRKIDLLQLGDVPKWLRERSAKPLCAGSNPAVASMPEQYYVYVLRSLRDGRRYIGYTENIERRINEHNRGLVKSTRSRRPFKLIYFEEFNDKAGALQRENFFKSGKGREYLNSVKTVLKL